MENLLPEYLRKDILVLGCGNILFGDDGFGPAAVKFIIDNYSLPPHVAVIDAGLSIRNILFDIVLSDLKPKKIIIIDAVDVEKKPGEVFELEIDNIPLKKIDDFSMHQMPTTNLLKELKRQSDIDIKIIAVQVENIPPFVSPGISESLYRSMQVVGDKVLKIVEGTDA